MNNFIGLEWDKFDRVRKIVEKRGLNLNYSKSIRGNVLEN